MLKKSRKPRVLIIISTSIIGGPGKGLLQFLKYADRSKFDYLLCSIDIKNKPEGEFVKQAVSSGLNVGQLRQRFRFDPSMIWQARDLIARNGIDIIQTHGYKEHVLGYFLKRICNKPWIGFAHGYTNENIKIRFYNKLDSLALRAPDIVVTVSNSLKSILTNFGVPEEKIRIIYNAIDRDELKPNLPPEEVRTQYSIKSEDKLVGVIGRLSPEKGQAVFLHAFKKVVEKMPFAKAIIIGDGQERGRLANFCSENGLRDRVIFTGYQNNIANFYQIMDILVLPSFSEGLPNVVLEAMAFKIPVIATSVGGVPEVIADGLNGLLVPPGNADLLAEKIIHLQGNERERGNIGENAFQSLYPRFSPEHRARQILTLYEELLS
jgi:glycosyltransferase involved in cell wall biosynthesis